MVGKTSMINGWIVRARTFIPLDGAISSTINWRGRVYSLKTLVLLVNMNACVNIIYFHTPHILIHLYLYIVKSPRGLKRKSKRKLKKSKIFCSKNVLPRQSERISMARERERELEPAQGTKIERERDLESLPEQRSREPEPAEEPAGPDQTLPSPTTGQGQALNDTQREVQSPPPPKERTATSYINVSVISFRSAFKARNDIRA